MTYQYVLSILVSKENALRYDFNGHNLDDIELIQNIIAIVKKQISQKPIDKSDLWAVCPVCGGSISLDNIQEHIENEENTFCEHCGQRLDWSE